MMYTIYSRAQTRRIISRTLAKIVTLSRQAPTPETESDIRRQAKVVTRVARRKMEESCRRTRQGGIVRLEHPGYDRQVARHNAIFNLQNLLWELKYQIRTADKRNDKLEVETGWLWDKLIVRLRGEPWVWDDESEDFQRKLFVGDVFSSTPSGKMYAPFARSNVTDDEAAVDEEYHENMEKEAEQHGLWVSWGDGDCFVGNSRDLDDLEIGDSFEIPEGHHVRNHGGGDFAVESPEVRGTVAKRTVKSRDEYTRSAIQKLIDAR